jgi:HPt (histidine-containing phosphotransfer) domain-containing protein
MDTSGLSNSYAPVVRRFLDGLPERCRRMAEAVSALSAEDEAEPRAALRLEAHRIAGTAGSMGYPALGEAAMAVEAVLDGGAPCEDVLAAHKALAMAAEGLRLEDSRLLAGPG